MCRLTASKEAGVTIEIDGKKVALGVPGAARPQDSKPDADAYPFIPLRRGGTPDDAAGSVLLYVLLLNLKVSLLTLGTL
jgi:3-oxoacyl-[acyl-carrier protein] reductase